ncbi:hypothetical protein ACLB1G_05295 [Oxalobacteraceae bacterium A2-2]
MKTSLHLLGMAALGLSLNAHADSFVSSASSAGSASSGSISDSLNGSSNSSSRRDRVADAEYRIIQVADAPGRPGYARVTMVAGQPEDRVELDLPAQTLARQALASGDRVRAQNRAYGIEFARADNGAAFFLVLKDEWYGELGARPVAI